MYACIYADIRLIHLIVTEKNINLRDKNGKNALFYVLNDRLNHLNQSSIVEVRLISEDN